MPNIVRAATDPITTPYGVFGVSGNPYIGKVTAKDGSVHERRPFPKQALFLSNKYNAIFDGFYGGAAGGAKSDAMLMAALQFVSLPTYRAMIMRETYAQLSKSGALMERANEWLSGTDARWRGKDYTWEFPSGAKLSFGHLENGLKSAKNYQGAEFHFIGIDEVTDLDEETITFLMSRVRATEGDSHIPLRFRTASNPIGKGLGWVKKRYVLPIKDRTKANIFQVTNDEGEVETRFFIPSSLKDNPYLNRDGKYRAALMRLDPVTRARLLRGDWDAQQVGDVFDTSYFGDAVPLSAVPARARYIRYWDLAGTDTEDNKASANTSGLLYAVDAATGYDYVVDLVKIQRNPTDVEYALMETAHSDGRDVEIYIEQEPGQSGKAQIHAFQRSMPGYTVHGDLPGKRGNKETRAKPVANKLGRKRIKVVEGAWNETFFTDLSAFPKNGKDTVDAFSGAHSAAHTNKKTKKTNTKKRKTGSGKPKITYRGEMM